MDSTEDTDPMAPRLDTTELAAAAAPSSCRRCACVLKTSRSHNTAFIYALVPSPLHSVQLLAFGVDGCKRGENAHTESPSCRP